MAATAHQLTKHKHGCNTLQTLWIRWSNSWESSPIYTLWEPKAHTACLLKILACTVTSTVLFLTTWSFQKWILWFVKALISQVKSLKLCGFCSFGNIFNSYDHYANASWVEDWQKCKQLWLLHHPLWPWCALSLLNFPPLLWLIISKKRRQRNKDFIKK